MNKKILLSIVTTLGFLCMCTTSICMDKDNKYYKNIWINDIGHNDIKVKVLDIDVSEEKIDIGEKYNAWAIVTMNVENKGLDSVELSNIDVYPYQGDKPTKYFVSTSKESITGFLGNLKSGESKGIKMGIALHNIKDTLELEFINIEDKSNEKVRESIYLK